MTNVTGIMVSDSGLVRAARPADALSLLSALLPIDVATVGAATLTVAQVRPANLLRRGGTQVGGFTDTLPTAALLTAAFANAENGDAFKFNYSNRTSQTATIAGGTGVTAVAGSGTTITAAASTEIVLQKTSATAWTFEFA